MICLLVQIGRNLFHVHSLNQTFYIIVIGINYSIFFIEGCTIMPDKFLFAQIGARKFKDTKINLVKVNVFLKQAVYANSSKK